MDPRGHARNWLATARARGVGNLRGQRSGRQTRAIAGKSILRVMGAYATYAGNGDVHPSQAALAKRAGVGKRTVEAVQDWLIEQGWLVVTAAAVKGIRGPTVRLTVPKPPTLPQQGANEAPDINGERPTKQEVVVSERSVRRAGGNVPVPIGAGVAAYKEAAQRSRDEPGVAATAQAARTAAWEQRKSEIRAGMEKPGGAWVRHAEHVLKDPEATDRARAEAHSTLEQAAAYEARMSTVPSFV